MTTESGREFHLIEFQQQNAASWRLLDAVTSQRDTMIRAHAGLFVIVSFVMGAKATQTQTTLLLCIGFVVLACASFSSTLLAQYNRGLQFLVYSAERVSRHALAGSDAFFSSLLDHPGMYPLRQQKDPMGYQVRGLRLITLLDTGIAAALITYEVATLVSDRQPLPVRAGDLALSLVVAAIAASAAGLVIHRRIVSSEAAISAHVEKRWKELFGPTAA